MSDNPASNEEQPKIRVVEDAAPVPTFGCVVYVAKAENGQVTARVANLAGIETTAATERDALATIVKTFKHQVAAATAAGTSIDWIDPPPAPQAGEQRRFIPVHL